MNTLFEVVDFVMSIIGCTAFTLLAVLFFGRYILGVPKDIDPTGTNMSLMVVFGVILFGTLVWMCVQNRENKP